jgi:acetyl esterase/lipase
MLSAIRKFLILACLSITVVHAQTRFRDYVFSTPEISKKIIFGTGISYQGTPDTLVLDFYQPANDTMTKRPLVVIIHGGSFTGGTHDDGWCVAVGTALALKGYACASIKYRVGIDLTKILADLTAARAQYSSALYRAIQDSRSAVRFLKGNSATYKIDTNNIFLCGYSAGAITAVHYVHMQQNELSAFGDTTGLGPFDIGSYLNVSSTVAGYISYAGAVSDTSIINAGEPPFLAFHGTGDVIVPYGSGPAYGSELMPVIFGSSIIHRVADRFNLLNKLVTYPDSSHMFAASPTLLPQTLDTVSEFLYSNFINKTHVSHIVKTQRIPARLSPATVHMINGRRINESLIYKPGIYITRRTTNSGKTIFNQNSVIK